MKHIIIGRDHEQQHLGKILTSPKAEFVALYGRRRVGKTYLIKSYFKHEDCVFFHITGMRNATLQEHIEEFTRTLENVFFKSAIFEIKEPTSWKDAFRLLTSAISQNASGQKVVIFLDELPWLASKKSKFLEALDFIWNRYWVDIPQIKLVVCGSAASWMIEKIIRNKGGLHNRLTAKIRLDPLTLKETKDYLKYKKFKYTDRHALEIYMCIGGIPYYLESLKKSLSVNQNIDNLLFHNKAELLFEFDQLFKSLFDHADIHEELIRVIATKRYGIERTELLKKATLSKDGGTFKKRLQELKHAGFITEYIPYGKSKKRGLYYRVIDEFTLFYLSWVEPRQKIIGKLAKPSRLWQELSAEPSWKSWSGYAFEAICEKHVQHIRESLNLSVLSEIAHWSYTPKNKNEDGAQIDLLFDRPDNAITLCEIKYSQKPFKLTKDYAKQLIRKTQIFAAQTGTQKSLHIALVTVDPITDTAHSEELIDARVTLKDIIDQ